LKYETDFQPFLPRRSNFQGAILIAMTTYQQPYSKMPQNVKLSSKYHPDNDTFDVTGKTGGSFHQIYDILESRMNFSTTKYYRNDGIFGDATTSLNNSLEVTGQLYFIHQNKSDVIIANHIMTHQRLNHLQFLPYVSPLKFTMWIQNIQKEEYTFGMYLSPFHWQLWMAIISIPLLTSIFLTISEETLTPKMTKKNILPKYYQSKVAWY
jgi:hypothetical protein